MHNILTNHMSCFYKKKKHHTLLDLIHLQNKVFLLKSHHFVSLALKSVPFLPEVAAVVGVRVAVFSHHHSVGKFPSC